MIKRLEEKEIINIVNIINEQDNNLTNIDKVKEELKNNPFLEYLIFKEDNEVKGFIKYTVMYTRSEIENIVVKCQDRGKLIGSKLIEFLMDDMKNRNVKNITLEVRKDNILAIKLYQKYGFKEKAIRKNYYKGIDGILMEVIL